MRDAAGINNLNETVWNLELFKTIGFPCLSASVEQDGMALLGVFCWGKNLFSVYNIFQVQIMKVCVWMLYMLSYYTGENQALCLKTGTLWEKFGGKCVQKTPDGSRHPNNTQIWSGVLESYWNTWTADACFLVPT